jgi:hypothetical protein
MASEELVPGDIVRMSPEANELMAKSRIDPWLPFLGLDETPGIITGYSMGGWGVEVNWLFADYCTVEKARDLVKVGHVET